MAAGPLHPPPDENDLHRLVDGQLDARRRGEVLLSLKSHAAEAAQVAAWRDQNSLLKTAFAGVDQDPIPASLRLTPLRLRCVDDRRVEDAALPPAPIAQAAVPHPQRSARLWASAGIVGLVAAAVFAASRVTSQHPQPPTSVLAAARQTDRPVAASAFEGSDASRRDASGAWAGASDPPTSSDLPTAVIPDLSPVGLAFVAAMVGDRPTHSLVFSYKDQAGSALTLSVSWSDGVGSAKAASGNALAWQRDGRSYSLSGSLDADRLAAVSDYLRSVAETQP